MMIDNDIKRNYMKLANGIAQIAQRYFFEDSLNEIYPRKTENELIEYWNMPVPEDGESVDEVLSQLEEGYMSGITGIINPKFLGYILTRPVPESHAFDLMANATHSTPGATHLALSATLIERCVLRWFAEKMCIPDFTGMFSSCGSISNLIAMKCARDRIIPRDEGVHSPIVIYASNETHYSLRRAWDVLGGGINQVRQFDSNDLDGLSNQIQRDKKDGFIPIAIVGNMGTTNTGTIEPLNELEKIAHSNNMWFHIDGAYGAPIMFLEEYKYLTAIVQRADSINIDPHKWIGMPAGTSAIYLNPKHSFIKSFAFNECFLDYQNMNCDTFDQCQMGLEGTRRFYGLKVWGAIKLLGFKEIEKRIRRCILLAKYFKNRLEEYSFIKIVNKVELSIVTFTIDGFDRERLLLLTGALFKSNQAFITVTQVGGMDALRCAIINYETTESMLDDIVFSIINEAKKIRAISE